MASLFAMPASSGDFLHHSEMAAYFGEHNYPFSAGRNPALPDDTELVIIRIGLLKELPAAT